MGACSAHVNCNANCSLKITISMMGKRYKIVFFLNDDKHFITYLENIVNSTNLLREIKIKRVDH